MLTYTPDVFSNIKTSDYVCVGADKIQVKILHLMLWLDSSGLRWLCCSASVAAKASDGADITQVTRGFDAAAEQSHTIHPLPVYSL